MTQDDASRAKQLKLKKGGEIQINIKSWKFENVGVSHENSGMFGLFGLVLVCQHAWWQLAAGSWFARDFPLQLAAHGSVKAADSTRVNGPAYPDT